MSSVKEELRLELRQRRAAIAAPERARAATALVTHFDKLPFDDIVCIGSYTPFGTELDTNPLMRRLTQEGSLVLALGRTVGPTMPLRFYPWRYGDPLDQDILGIPAPLVGQEVLPNLLLVPLVGVDRTGNRLGQGAGIYDRTIARLRACSGHKLVTVGVAFDCQVIENMPPEPHDEKLDFILTESGVMVPSQN